ncbi:hypothetical protein SORBI_3005G075400 [Sorghum bicolor]|uniref:Protein kinase domain-containing protein n=1 Tax=Sorghum bicolor TaxID=4558 RepID=A0A1Z5RHJ9_SORBI|nr:hypothetical protein SORBI_3005G075400 [Sorghum bicolor]
MPQIVHGESANGGANPPGPQACPPLRPWLPSCRHDLQLANDNSNVNAAVPVDHCCSGDGSSAAALSSSHRNAAAAAAVFLIFLTCGFFTGCFGGMRGTDNTNFNTHIEPILLYLFLYYSGVLVSHHLLVYGLLVLRSWLKFIADVKELVTSVYSILTRKSVMVRLLVMLFSALVFGALDLGLNNWSGMRRARDSAILHNYYDESHGRTLLAFNHDKDSTVRVDLRMTTPVNADGSGQDQKALAHWISDHNRDRSGKYYVTDKQKRPQKPHLSEHKTIKTGVVWWIVIASAIFIVVVVCFVAALLWYKCRNRGQQNQPQVQLQLCRVKGPRPFEYNELAAATNNFSDENKLGQGGFGPVYRGFLTDPDRHVAVKVLSADSSWQGHKEFEAEVKVLTQLRHRNIVELVGWCDSNEGLLLVYELMAQGSLDKHLHNPVRVLSWQQRYKIILDLGSALLYLHRCCDKCIVHGDIKPENVMLDASYNAKLGDFGTARLIEHGAEPRATEIVAGTRGYIDPEFVNNHLRCPEADIYSFGVALLEIASGKRPASRSRQPDEASALLVCRLRDLYDQRMVLDAADAKMNGEFDQQQMERVLVTGLWCAHQDPSQRPSIEQAMDVLRSADAMLPVLPATHDPQHIRILEEHAYGDLTGEGTAVDAVVPASTCYLTSKDSAYLLAEE